MGKKKKSADNKLAKMSDEDRARYLQHRADIEEETRRRKQEVIGTYLKNKLKKEENFIRINLAKINQEWRHILRRTKCVELKNELEAVQKAMCEAMNRKDAQIKYLLNEIDECENQYDRTFQTHLTNMHTLLKIYRDRLNALNEWYEHHKDKQVLTSVRNKMQIETIYNSHMTHLKTIMYQHHQHFNKDVQQSTERRLQSKQQLDSEMKVYSEIYSKQKDSEIGELWKKITNVLNEYFEKTEPRRKEYELLCNRDEKDQEVIKKQNTVIEDQMKLLARLQDHFEEVKETKNRHIEVLKQQKEILQKKLLTFKKRTTTSNDTDRSQLKKLTTISYEVLDYFKKVHAKGENLLNLIQVCRKFETEKEKILPWKGYEELPSTSNQEPEKINLLDKFWWRHSCVHTEVLSMREEKQMLEKENKELRARVQEFMKEVVLDGPTRTSKISLDLVPQITVTPLNKKHSNITLAALNLSS